MEVNFKDKSVTIVTNAGKTLAEKDVKKAFKDTRFSVTSFETVAEKKDEDKGDGDDADDKKKDPKKDDGTKKKKEGPPKKSD